MRCASRVILGHPTPEGACLDQPQNSPSRTARKEDTRAPAQAPERSSETVTDAPADIGQLAERGRACDGDWTHTDYLA